MQRIRQVGCVTCDATWPARTARYCGHCGAALQAGDDPTSPTPAGSPGRRVPWSLVPALAAAAVAMVTMAAMVTIVGPFAGDTGTAGTAARSSGRAVEPTTGTQTPGVATPDDASPNPASPSSSDVVDIDPLRRTRTDPARWRTRFDADITAVTVAARSVVVGTADGALHHLDGDHGTRYWVGWVGAAPRVLHLDTGRAVVGTDDGRLVALDTDTGQRRWETLLDPERRPTTITGSDAGLLVTVGPTRNRQLIAVDPRNGEVRWRRDLTTESIEVGGSSVQLTGTALQGWDAARPSPRWRLEVGAGERLVGRTDRYVVTQDVAGTRFRDPATGRIAVTAGPDAPWWIMHAATDCLEVDDCLDDLAAEQGRSPDVVGLSGTTTILVSRPRAVAMAGATASAPNARGIDELVPSGVRGVGRSDQAHRWRFGDAEVLVSVDPLVVAGQRVAIGPPLDADAAASAREAAVRRTGTAARARVPWPLAQPNALSPR